MLLGFFGHLVNFDHGNWIFQAPELAHSSGYALMYVGFLGTLATEFGYFPAAFVVSKFIRQSYTLTLRVNALLLVTYLSFY